MEKYLEIVGDSEIAEYLGKDDIDEKQLKEKLEHYLYLINTLKTVGQVWDINGRINDCYKSFFRKRGCKTEEYDFCAIRTIIERISPV